MEQLSYLILRCTPGIGKFCLGNWLCGFLTYLFFFFVLKQSKDGPYDCKLTELFKADLAMAEDSDSWFWQASEYLSIRTFCAVCRVQRTPVSRLASNSDWHETKKSAITRLLLSGLISHIQSMPVSLKVWRQNDFTRSSGHMTVKAETNETHYLIAEVRQGF